MCCTTRDSFGKLVSVVSRWNYRCQSTPLIGADTFLADKPSVVEQVVDQGSHESSWSRSYQEQSQCRVAVVADPPCLVAGTFAAASSVADSSSFADGDVRSSSA